MSTNDLRPIRLAWRQMACLVLAAIGTGVSTYLTLTHYDRGAVPLVCSTTSLINCAKVTTSPQSVIFGIPVAVLGLPFFLSMMVLSIPAAWRTPVRNIHLARLALSVVGMCFVIYLIYVELFDVGAICLWCTSVHIMTFLLFVIIVTATPSLILQLDGPVVNMQGHSRPR
ncbi:MAG: vitamin K epoxide reductase family protein [Actinobacteria bacterium]|nr:vitamin K epoxide reductase family protein [Actinomycetota bacterium]